MKKSFMTRVLAVTLSTAMAFSVSSAGNLVTASAATKPFVSLKTKFKTLTVGQKYKMTLKNNSIKWRIQSATSTDKTICKPYIVKPTYVKLKALKEGRVKVTYKLKTTKRKTNNTKTLKGTVQVNAAKDPGTEEPGATFSATATAADTANVKITFSQAIDTEGVTAENFAINKDVAVRDAKVSEDGKTVDLTIAGATYNTEYEVTVSGIKVAGEAKDAITCKFTTPEAAAGYQLVLDCDSEKPIKSDGQTTRVIKFELRDSAGNLVEEDGVEVLFETTLGSFAQPRAVLDKGVAENTFTSQALNSTRTAQITATIMAANNQELIGKSQIGNITLTPNPEQLTDTSIGAIITNVVAPTADRVVAYFQKEVEAKDFRTANGALDLTKFEAKVTSNVNSTAQEHNVVGIVDVEGEPNALELLVDTPMVDNTTIKVDFKDKRSTNSVISSSNTVYCKLTDGYQPSALKVNVVNSRTLEVEFSEAVLRSLDAKNTENKNYAADLVENYAIDAMDLNKYAVKNQEIKDVNNSESGTVYKISEKDTNEDVANGDGTITIGNYNNGVDNRNIVTIKLGEGHALRTGRHSLSISNVGDWAALTDGWRNILDTATVDFVVPDDVNTPNFTYEVMSPEQFKLTANCEFTLASGKTFKTENSNAASATPVVKLQEQRGSEWVTISDDKYTGEGCGFNPIMVSRIKDSKTGLLTNEYLVETTEDWTKVLNTRSTNQSYYNKRYRLRIDANQIRNLGNDKWNEAININLYEDPIMQGIDGTSPTIKSIEQVQDADGNLTKNYQVTFSEPVKMSNSANKEGMTPTQDAAAASMYSAYFVKKDSSLKSVQAKVNDKSFIDATDTMIQVEPVSDLEAGTWDLYVRGVADDYGNTTATLSGTITVEAQTVTSDFKVVWAAVSTDGSYGNITAGEGHYILVKFNKQINLSGGSVNAGSTLNYQINGNPLPTGSYIRANITGYDTETNGVDSITIVLPKGTTDSPLGGNTMNYPVNGSRAILTISSALTSAEGVQLSTEPGYNLPYQFGEAGGDPNFGLTTANDAVWGNDDSETSAKITSKENYIAELKKALANDKYRMVRLDKDMPEKWLTNGVLDLGNEELKINRVVDIDFNGVSINGNIRIDTDDEANRINIINSQGVAAPVTVKGNLEGENTATLIVDTPYTNVRIASNITFDKGNSEKAWIIQSVPSNTLTTAATVIGDIVITGNGVGMNNSGDLSKAPIKVDTTGTVYLKGSYTSTDITLTKKVTLNLADIESNVKVIAEVKESTIVVNEIEGETNKVTVVAVADDILVKYASSDDVELKAEGGSIKQQFINGDTPTTLQPVTGAGAQSFIEGLTVINGAEPSGLVEIITASAASGSSVVFTHGENNATNLVTALKDTTGTVEGDNASYKIANVSIAVSGSNLKYDSSAGTVTYTVPTGTPLNEIKFTFTVEATENGTTTTRTITKTVKVTKVN